MPQTTGNSTVTGQPKDILVHLHHKNGMQMQRIRKRTMKVTENKPPFHTDTAQWSNPEAEMKNLCAYKNNDFKVRRSVATHGISDCGGKTSWHLRFMKG
jgi:hypothetical protein